MKSQMILLTHLLLVAQLILLLAALDQVVQVDLDLLQFHLVLLADHHQAAQAAQLMQPLS